MLSTATENPNALYLYAIVPQSACERFGDDPDSGLRLVRGAAHAAVVRPTAELPVVSHSRQDLARLLLAHQQVIETVMARSPVLPVKFATVAPDRASVEQCLARGAAEFAASFARLAGKVQFEVLAVWDPGQVLARIGQQPAVVQMVRNKMAPAELGAVVKRLFDQHRIEVAGGLAAALRAIAVEVVEAARMDDRMVLNLALLIGAGETGALDDCLEDLDAAHDGQLNFRCVGPLPPHSFATVEISFLDAGQISWARGILDLEEGAGVAELRRAYRRLARKLHPDIAGATDTGGMANLHTAYRTLRAFAEARGPVRVSVARQDPGAGGIAPH